MEKLIEYLQKFDYDFTVENKNSLKVFIDRKLLVIIIKKKENEKYEISNATIKWNYVSGQLNTPIRKNLESNSVILLISWFLIEAIKSFTYLNFTLLLIITGLVYYSWFFYFFIQYEMTKSRIEKILNGN